MELGFNVVEGHLQKTDYGVSSGKQYVSLSLFAPIMHLSFLVVHKDADLLRSHVEVDVSGRFRSEGVLVPEQRSEKVFISTHLFSTSLLLSINC